MKLIVLPKGIKMGNNSKKHIEKNNGFPPANMARFNIGREVVPTDR
jgi:hypothetical protein